MVKIALCDDETEYLDFMEKSIHEKLLSAGVEHTFERFLNGNDILNSSNNDTFYAVFLDIDMPEISGLQVGSRLTRLNENVKIIFVSNHDELVYEAIHARPVRFIRKRYIERELSEAIEFLLEEIKKDSKIILLKYGKRQNLVKADSIIYFESAGHYIMVVTANKRIKVRAKISEYLNEIKNYGFVQIQKGIVVNMKYIVHKKRDTVILQTGEKFTISRSRIAEVEKEFMKFLRVGG